MGAFKMLVFYDCIKTTDIINKTHRGETNIHNIDVYMKVTIHYSIVNVPSLIK